MSRLTWGAPTDRRFETGCDRGVLYLPNPAGVYDEGVPWNGLVSVTESPSGAESNKQYADNGVYVNLLSAEEFSATLEAFTYPDEFEECDGSVSPKPGVTIGQQGRRMFGLAYRTLIGTAANSRAGYKIHLVYGAQAAPSEKAYNTVNDSPEATTLSWELSTTPVAVGTIGGVEYLPAALVTIDSTKVAAEDLTALEDMLYGTVTEEAQLPSPAEVVALFDGVVVP